MAAKRTALDKLESGLMGGPRQQTQPEVEESELSGYVTIHVTNTPSNSSLCLYLSDLNGGRAGLEPRTSCV